MFTMKHYAADGTRVVHGCDNYMITPPGVEVAAGDPPENHIIHLFDKLNPDTGTASKLTVEVRPGEQVYIENADGHTIDTIRA